MKKTKEENFKKKKPDANIAQISPRGTLVTDEPNQPGWDASFILGIKHAATPHSASPSPPHPPPQQKPRESLGGSISDFFNII